MKRILATLLAFAAFTCYGTAQATRNAEEKAEQASKKTHEPNVKITKGPTIEYASADKAVIAWSTNVPSSTVLRYGTDPNSLSQRAEAPYGGDTHRVHLNNLKASTNYYFTFESEHGKGTGTEAESNQTYGFRTTATNAQAIHEQPAVTASQLQSGAAPAATTTAATPAATAEQGQREPLYRLSSSSDRLYTTSSTEMNKAKTEGYNFEGVAGYVATSQIASTAPLYRLVKSASGKNTHFYTANATEMKSAQSQGFRLEGVIGYVPTSQMPGTVPLERLRSNTGEYLYTTSATEKQQAVSRYHYQDQGVACYIWQS